jgi:hypothetical protein
MEREHRLTNLSNRFVDSGVKPLKSKEHKMRMVGPGGVHTCCDFNHLICPAGPNNATARKRQFRKLSSRCVRTGANQKQVHHTLFATLFSQLGIKAIVKHQRDAREFPTKNRRSPGAGSSTAAMTPPLLPDCVGLLAGSIGCACPPLNQRRGRVKPVSEDQLVSGNLSNLRVASLEGLRASRYFNILSDKQGGFRAFDNKHLIGAVRITRPHSTLSELPEKYAPTSAS